MGWVMDLERRLLQRAAIPVFVVRCDHELLQKPKTLSDVKDKELKGLLVKVGIRSTTDVAQKAKNGSEGLGDLRCSLRC
jgi:hypothetical protein